MKRKHIILLAVVLSLIVMIPAGVFLFGFAANAGRIGQTVGLIPKAPMEQYGSLWLSDEPWVSIRVSEAGVYKPYTAYIMRDGAETEVSVNLEPGKGFSINTRDYDSLHGTLLRGTIREWSETEVFIDVTEDNVFGGAYDTIVLRRAKGS